MRNRRDRERAECPRCGRTVTVTRSGRLMAHRETDGKSCVSAAYHERQDASKAPQQNPGRPETPPTGQPGDTLSLQIPIPGNHADD